MGDGADLLMPKLGLTMTEGTVARWLVTPGQRFGAGDVIVVIETDKIANEVEAPADGEITALLSSEGDVLPVGTPIARWRLEGAVTTARAATGEAPRKQVADSWEKIPQHSAQQAHFPRGSKRIIATPYARRLAREGGIDLALVAGSGWSGRIKADDVLRAKASKASSRQLTPVTSAAERATDANAPLASSSFVSADVDVGALRALDASLAGTRDRAFERLPYIALACAKVFCGDGDGSVRLRFQKDGGPASIEVSCRDTLSVVTARIATAGQVSRGSDGDVAVFIVEGRARLFVPAIVTGSRFTLGVGGVRAVRGDDAAHEMTLALTYDNSALDHAAAASMVDRIAALLEEPLHLLAV